MRFFQTLAEGGQTWSHRVRMVKQVLKIAIGYSLLVALIYLVCAGYSLNFLNLQGSYYHFKGLAVQSFSDTTTVSGSYWHKMTGEKKSSKTLSTKKLIRITKPQLNALKTETITLASKASTIAIITFGITLLFFMLRGTTSKKQQHISGKKRVHPLLLRLKLTLTRKASPIKVGSLPLIKGTETQHILVTGGTGTGKTNCFHEVLPKIRQQNHKAIIIDTTQTFVKKYYDPKKDYLINPFDRRSVEWHPWIECVDAFDFDNIAESLIPQSYHDNENYWRTAARTLVSSVLMLTRDCKQTSGLARWLLFEPLDRLADFVQGTKAAAHIDINSEKTAASIRSVASSFLSGLEYLQDTKGPFSIRKWVQDPNEKGWLFLSCTPSQRASLNSLLSCWFSIAVRSLLQLEPSFKRRIWFIVDELPTIHKLKELEPFVTESRKYGGCGLFALQSPAQLDEIYGRASSQTIVGNCATRVIFAEHDPEIAKRISNSLGEAEVKEYQEGISYGAHEMRDGVTLSLQSKTRPIVSTTDIQSLGTNKAFVKLPGNVPITHVKLKIRK